MITIGVLASHNGSSFVALHQASLDVCIVIVASNNPSSNALTYAKAHGIASHIVDAEAMEDCFGGCDYLLASGYMKHIPDAITRKYKIINSHPSLLPKFGGVGMYGRRVHEAVIASGEAVSGCTIHYVNEHYDEGEILLQKSLTLAPNETPQSLEARIKALEAEALIEVFERLSKIKS